MLLGRHRDILIQNLLRGRADATRADDVAGDAGPAGKVEHRLSGDRVGRILDGGKAGEIAAALRGGRKRRLRRSRLRPVLQALIVAEDEQPVLLDRTAARSAELILPGLRAPRLEETARIQFVVAQELPERAVKLIGSRFRCDGDLAARVISILRREVSRLNADLLHGVGRRHVHAGGLAEVSEIRAVEREVIIHRSSAIDAHVGAAARIRDLLRRGHIRNPGDDARQAHDVASAQGEVLHAPVVHQAGESLVSRVDESRGAGDGDFARQRADFQSDVDAEILAGGEPHAGLHLLFKSRARLCEMSYTAGLHAIAD